MIDGLIEKKKQQETDAEHQTQLEKRRKAALEKKIADLEAELQLKEKLSQLKTPEIEFSIIGVRPEGSEYREPRGYQVLLTKKGGYEALIGKDSGISDPDGQYRITLTDENKILIEYVARKWASHGYNQRSWNFYWHPTTRLHHYHALQWLKKQ